MKLASIETIKELLPHPNADRLELAKVLGWQAVVKKGDFHAGDRCVFAVIDTILPDAPWSEFLKDGNKPIRLRTVKLRGQFSQGLVIHLNVLPEHMQSWQDGSDVGGELGIKKYEKEISSSLSGEIKEAFPEYICAKTDEDNGLSNPNIVEETLKHGELTVTQKLDGSSMTIVIEDGAITHVCSRRLSLKDTPGNAFWMAARKMLIKGSWIYGRVIIQGELMGPGIQGNQLGLMEPELFVYQIRVIEGPDDYWMNYARMADDAGRCGVKCVPKVWVGNLGNDAPLEELQELANRQILPSGKPAEGIVVRPTYARSNGIGRPLGFKIINQHYGE